MDQEIKELLKEVSDLLSEQGHFKLIDLKRVEDKLTKSQRIYVKYIEDLQKKIPRKEAQNWEKTFKYPKIKTYLVGSYRREKEQMGDLDLIIVLGKIFFSGADGLGTSAEVWWQRRSWPTFCRSDCTVLARLQDRTAASCAEDSGRLQDGLSRSHSAKILLNVAFRQDFRPKSM